MVSSWKKYWFVLEGRLLLYYRSKDEYEAISPCKGSINLGPLCKIVPALATSCIFQIETRSNTVTLVSKFLFFFLGHKLRMQKIKTLIRERLHFDVRTIKVNKKKKKERIHHTFYIRSTVAIIE